MLPERGTNSIHSESYGRVRDYIEVFNHAWFRGLWFDPVTMALRDVEAGAAYDRPPVTDGDPVDGATLFVPFALELGACRTIRLRLAWYVPNTRLRAASDHGDFYRPWYARRFGDVAALTEYWRMNYDKLRSAWRASRNAFTTRPFRRKRSKQ